ncbi:hypothetical protein IMSAGC019_02149 [Lachnospiraceae bacterium]|nr:hypothetical protein IMSAGC019_02149 [Lachnospiraceae bacterium]
MVKGRAVEAYTSATTNRLFRKKPSLPNPLKNLSASTNIRKIGTTI